LGSFMVALSIIVTQIIRLKLAVLYPTTVVVRIFFITVIIGLYLKSHDPLFLMILGVVSLGLFLTLAGLILDLRNSKTPWCQRGPSRWSQRHVHRRRPGQFE
jgi:hypothetical protein